MLRSMWILLIRIKNRACLTHLIFILRELEQKLSNVLEFKILFNSNHSLEERIIREQFNN